MAGCTQVSTPSGSCPERFTSAVIWSSPTSRNSSVQFFDGDRLVGEIAIRVQGLDPSGQAPIWAHGQVATLSTGDAKHDQSNIVAFSPTTCEVILTRLNEPVALNLASLDDGYLTVSNLNNVSYLRKYSPGNSKPVRTTPYQDEFITAALTSDGQVYAEAESLLKPGTVSLITAKASDLSEIDRLELPELTGGGLSMTLAAGKLVIPITLDATENEDSRLLVVDPATHAMHTIELGYASPYYVHSVGDTVYVAHTFINPGFHPFSSYRRVSVVDMTNESVTGHDLSTGVQRIAVTSTSLAALGQDTDETPVLHTYSLPDFKQLVKIRLSPPASVPNAYAASVFLPE